MKKNFYLLLICSAFALQVTAQCWRQVSPGAVFTLAIKTDGTLWGWGYNNYGQLGIGNTTDKLWPTQVGTEADWKTVAAGGEYSYAIKTDGTLWAWGANYNGFLGLGYNSLPQLSPIQVGTESNWAFIEPGLGGHTIALKTDGTLWAWGLNGLGELGVGNNTSYNSPQQVGTATDWQTASAGYSHTLAIKTDGTLWAWGYNADGQLGIGNNTNSNVPVQVETATNWQSVAAAYLCSHALTTAGTLWNWGRNDFGQLGTGNTVYTNSPVQEVTLSANWKTITTGQVFTQALKTDNTLWAWGYGYDGEGFISTPTPGQVGTASNWDTVANKWNDGFGLQTGNIMYGWGDNTFGALGNGTTTSSVNTQVTCNFVLPVTWLSVNGQLQNNYATIQWATASESNTSHFEIEHSSNGVSFVKTGIVSAAGNSSSISTYSFTHTHPVPGKNYYRVKQVDLDGKFSYSRIITLTGNKEQNSISISPNPAQDYIQVSINNTQPATIRIFNMQGKLMQQHLFTAGNQQRSITISTLPAGMYQLQFITAETSKTISFMKQ